MRKLISLLLGIPAIVVCVSLAYSTFQGYLHWYRLAPGCRAILDDGSQVECWLHRHLGGGDATLVSLRRDSVVTTYVLMEEARIALSHDAVGAWPLWAEGDLLPPQPDPVPKSERIPYSRSPDGSEIELKLDGGLKRLRVTTGP